MGLRRVGYYEFAQTHDSQGGRDGVVEDQVDFQVEQVGRLEEHGLLGMGMEQIHGVVHMVELQSLTRRQVDLGQPAISDTKLLLWITQPVGDHGQQDSLVRRLGASSFLNTLQRLLQSQLLPEGFDDHGAAQGKGLLDLEASGKR